MGKHDGINISIRDVYDASITINRCSRDLDVTFRDIKRKVSDLTSSWECTASKKLKEDFVSLDRKFINCRDVIRQYAEYLSQTAESYERTESKNKSNASAFD